MKDRELELEKKIDELKKESNGEENEEEIIKLEKEYVKSIFSRMFFGDAEETKKN